MYCWQYCFQSWHSVLFTSEDFFEGSLALKPTSPPRWNLAQVSWASQLFVLQPSQWHWKLLAMPSLGHGGRGEGGKRWFPNPWFVLAKTTLDSKKVFSPPRRHDVGFWEGENNDWKLVGTKRLLGMFCLEDEGCSVSSERWSFERVLQDELDKKIEWGFS